MMKWIETFANHKIAANGAMILIIALGLWSVGKINNQFFPDFETSRISASVSWSGVSAEDMYNTTGAPLQQALIGLPELDGITTSASEGRVSLSIGVSDRAESVEAAADLVEETLAAVSLPEDAGEVNVSMPQRRENVADFLLYGDVGLDELASYAYSVQSDLLQTGFAQVSLQGIPSQEVQVSVAMETLLDTGLTLAQISQSIEQEYTPSPAGTSSGDSITLQLRSQTPEIELNSLLNTVVQSLEDGSVLTLADVATVKQIEAKQSNQLYFEGLPAIRISLLRTLGEDTLENAELMNQWLEEFIPTLPQSVQLHIYNETWKIVESQLSLLIDNGLLGMALVLVTLFIFLNTRLAFWVALGIPISFFATFIIMAQLGISMNTISLFGFMIALGIIVDDAIVVGEQARAYQQQGLPANAASLKAAKKMWPPVLASSLTTIAAFLPLTFISGPIGRLSVDLPVIVTIAIVASLIECFLILPGHLSHSNHKEDRPFRKKMDAGYNFVRDQYFRPIVRWSLTHRAILISMIVAGFIIAVGMITSRTVPFQFQPSVEAPSLSVSVAFTEGADQTKVDNFVDHLADTLQAVEDETGYDFIKTALITRNQGNQGNQARIDVELISDQNRPYTNQELVNQWRQATNLPSEIDSISFGRGRRWGGESGDISIELSGSNVTLLKAAALELQNRLEALDALSDATDTLAYGDEQLQFSLTPLAIDLGITEATLANFLRQHIEGVKATTVIDGSQTFDVIVMLPEAQRRTINEIMALPYRLADNSLVPMQDLINSSYQRGIETIRAQDGVISASVSATLDTDQMTSDSMYTLLEESVLPAFAAQYGGIDVELAGDAQEQEQFFAETMLILLAVLALIYGILAWVFESWIWPLAILATIPFGLTGAIFGHWIIDLPLSSLSILGLFGLSGIVINDSIVLISVYQELRDEGLEIVHALEEAVARRLRPVILTTVTTMSGLTPFLFETSLDAEFLKPIAAGIVFGLLFGTTLILLFVPALLLTIEQIKLKLNLIRQ
ncbi:efflux RND transporter permease subunit [Reinekea marina]|uniref:Efflux RND transporter permease subunit n=1 Tax=Reinekea marina TaxID=1310421 RepID=A0ABV7WRN1_9GAMM|nr:efflux RND transporter permease subunit [Reinekea marina]MDN3647359.1 efflux RND transporter permease subunit [Reinekea marina]